MKLVKKFDNLIDAYRARYAFIAEAGGTRSGKTFRICQLIYLIMLHSKKRLVITIVSHSFPHLYGGAIRDFENILASEDVNIDQARTKNPHIYRIGKSLLEFVGFDKPGKALGAARDILFINEANKMSFAICHQLITRTTATVFADWNPSETFWFESEGFAERKDTILLHSTFKDNIENLSPRQLNELKHARNRAMAEDKACKHGYWWNWWQVYGLGLKGQLDGVIFQNWQTYSTLPEGVELYRLLGIDWGGNDPTTLIEAHIAEREKLLYLRQLVYQPQILNNKLINIIIENNPHDNFVICDSARRDKIYELQNAGIKAIGSTKGEGSVIDGIERMQQYQIYVHEESADMIKEFASYKWIKDPKTERSLNEPEDKNNHCIDSARYLLRFYKKSINPR